MAETSQLPYWGRMCCRARHDDRRIIVLGSTASLATPLPVQPSRGAQRMSQVCERNPPRPTRTRLRRPRRRASVTNPRRAICIARGTHNTSQWLRGCVSTRRHFRRRSDELHEHGRSGSARRQQRLRVVESSSSLFESLAFAQSMRRVVAVACTVNVVCVICRIAAARHPAPPTRPTGTVSVSLGPQSPPLRPLPFTTAMMIGPRMLCFVTGPLTDPPSLRVGGFFAFLCDP